MVKMRQLERSMVTGEAGAALFAYLLQFFLPIVLRSMQTTEIWKNFAVREGVVVFASAAFIVVNLLLREDYSFGLAMCLVFLGMNFADLRCVYDRIFYKSMCALFSDVRTEEFFVRRELINSFAATKAPNLLIAESREIIHKMLALFLI